MNPVAPVTAMLRIGAEPSIQSEGNFTDSSLASAVLKSSENAYLLRLPSSSVVQKDADSAGPRAAERKLDTGPSNQSLWRRLTCHPYFCAAPLGTLHEIFACSKPR